MGRRSMQGLGARVRTAGAVAVIAAAAACGGSNDPGTAGTGGPASGDLVARGESLYQETCAACHGPDLEGSETGPPLLDVIYAPNHHPDTAFYAAVQNGVQPHHWDFGPMPPQPSVSPDEIEAIVAYVRAEQESAGITEDPSHS